MLGKNTRIKRKRKRKNELLKIIDYHKNEIIRKGENRVIMKKISLKENSRVRIGEGRQY